MAQVVQYAPLEQPIIEPPKAGRPWDQFSLAGIVTQIWAQFFRWAQAILNTTPQVIGTVALTAQGASIAATTIATTFPSRPNVRLLPGMYRVTTYARVTRVGSVSSGIQVSVRFTDGTVVVTRAGTNQTGNLTTTTDHNTWLVRVDSATQIQYLTSYTDGGGATSMQYSLDIVVEAIPEAA